MRHALAFTTLMAAPLAHVAAQMLDMRHHERVDVARTRDGKLNAGLRQWVDFEVAATTGGRH